MDPVARRAHRRHALGTALALFVVAASPAAAAAVAVAAAVPADDPTGGDPLGSQQWPELRKEFLGGANARVEFDPKVQVHAPAFAEDAMNVPISVETEGLAGVERIVVLVDRNPIRKVLEFEPLGGTLAALSFRFKLEQASPVRAAVRTRDGIWHVGAAMIDASGGGCTAAGATRKDGSWARTLGQVSGRMFEGHDGGPPRLRVRVMHPMDTGLVAGIPAFYLKKVQVHDGGGTELLRLSTWEPISENPVFSFDFTRRPDGPLRITGVDNNGNRVEGAL